MEPSEPPARRLLIAHARTEAFAPHTRSILAKMGYPIVPCEDLEALPEPLPHQKPDLRIVDERRLGEIPDDEDEGQVPMIVLTGRQGVTGADPRIMGALPRPAGLHGLYRLIQQALEEQPRTVPRVATHLAAHCRRNGKEWRTAVVSLSESGCLVRSPEPIPLGSQLEIGFDLPGGARIDARAEAAYQMPPDLGLVFHETQPAQRRAIAEFVASALEKS